MSRSHLALVLWLLLITSSVGHIYGARQSQIFKMIKPSSQNSSPSTFMGFLPKGMPVPPSGPSKRHNGIGIKSSNSLP
ncbi:Protein IDA [Salix suchowensis]|nr:Protein IDA [Salix suchowensis]